MMLPGFIVVFGAAGALAAGQSIIQLAIILIYVFLTTTLVVALRMYAGRRSRT